MNETIFKKILISLNAWKIKELKNLIKHCKHFFYIGTIKLKIELFVS